ncbi:MAG TPA: GGDEF domain-containing protein, partial [Acidobacteriaceae bacterium]|nr:GGDEF domain-containing protein [Acidobacteriaceae bacterium]
AAVGEALRRECREPDVVGRLGGEEFAILLSCASLEVATAVAERIRHRLCSTVVPVTEATRITVTASFGVAAQSPGDTCQDLLARADAALYRAKRAGRDRVVAMDGLNQQAEQHLEAVCAA